MKKQKQGVAINREGCVVYVDPRDHCAGCYHSQPQKVKFRPAGKAAVAEEQAKRDAKRRKEYDAETVRLYKKVENDLNELKKCQFRGTPWKQKKQWISTLKNQIDYIQKMKTADRDGTLIRGYVSKQHTQFVHMYKDMSDFFDKSKGYGTSGSISSARVREINDLKGQIRETEWQIHKMRISGCSQSDIYMKEDELSSLQRELSLTEKNL